MKALKTIITWILSITLGIAVFTIFMIGNISSFFTTESIQKTATSIDVTHEINKIKNSTATAGSKAELADIIDVAYSEADKHGISHKLVDEIVNSNEVKQFLGKTIGNTTNYVVNGKESEKTTSEDFNKLLDDNMDKWIKDSGIKISDSKKDVLLVRMKSASASFINNLPDTTTVNNKIDESTLKQVQFLFSPEVKTALIITIIACLALILLLKRKHYKWLLYYATPAIITGLITIALSFVLVDVLTQILNTYNLSFMVSAFSNSLSHNILTAGIVTVIIATVLYIIYGLLSRKEKRA